MKDKDIDLKNLPEVEDTPFGQPPLINPRSKKKLWIIADKTVVDYFQEQGPDWQERIATVLKHYVIAKKMG